MQHITHMPCINSTHIFWHSCKTRCIEATVLKSNFANCAHRSFVCFSLRVFWGVFATQQPHTALESLSVYVCVSECVSASGQYVCHKHSFDHNLCELSEAKRTDVLSAQFAFALARTSSTSSYTRRVHTQLQKHCGTGEWNYSEWTILCASAVHAWRKQTHWWYRVNVQDVYQRVGGTSWAWCSRWAHQRSHQQPPS